MSTKPACICVRSARQIFDPSGNLWDGDEDLSYSMVQAGWTWRRIPVIGTHYDHDVKCPVATWIPPLLTYAEIEAMFKAQKQTHVGNGAYLGAFAFTLTKSPKDSFTVADMIKAVQKVMSQKSQPPKRYAWYLEYKGTDEAGLPAHPHIHGMYETENGRKIEDKHWKRAWPIWMEKDPVTKKVIRLGAGFRGGYHRPVKLEENYDDYIKKDGGVGEAWPLQ